MSYALAVPIRIVASLGALGLTPYLLTRALFPRLALIPSLASAGLTAVLLNVGTCVTCHLARIPLTPELLASAHTVLLGLASIVWRLRPPRPFPAPSKEEMRLAGLVILLALLIMPVTHLTGIDTYKWQDLATATAVEQSVPWLMHPLSLCGFTARSYPSAHPLYLATIQILTGLGVDWGMYVMSVTIGILGLTSAYWLGITIAASTPGRDRFALWFALLYAFSPVFMRYTYWATGRGLFLAILPLFLVALLKLPKPAAWAGLLLTAAILPMTHKTGSIAVALIAMGSCLTPISRMVKTRPRLVVALVPFALGAVALSPSLAFAWPAGTPIGFARQAVSRFSWYVPIAMVGLVVTPGWWHESPRCRLLAPLLITLPFAFVEEMYGAMVALPFAVAATTRGVQFLTETWRPAGKLIPMALATLTVAAALGIVIHRAAPATPRRVRAAAAFIELADPHGPFLLIAPGLARGQMQAYVSGCPRFALSTPGKTHIVLSGETFPSYRGNLQAFIRDVIQFLRRFAGVSGIEGDWYGNPTRTYHVTIDGEGPIPENAYPLYDRDGVQIHRVGDAP